MGAEKRSFNWLFWLMAIVFSVISLEFILQTIQVSWGYLFWEFLMQGLFFLTATGLFIAKNRAGWYLITGYFCYIVLLALGSQLWAAAYYDMWDVLPALVGTQTLPLLLLSALAVLPICLKKIRVDVFGIGSRGLVWKTTLAIVATGAVTALIPWSLGSKYL